MLLSIIIKISSCPCTVIKFIYPILLPEWSIGSSSIALLRPLSFDLSTSRDSSIAATLPTVDLVSVLEQVAVRESEEEEEEEGENPVSTASVGFRHTDLSPPISTSRDPSVGHGYCGGSSDAAPSAMSERKTQLSISLSHRGESKLL